LCATARAGFFGVGVVCAASLRPGTIKVAARAPATVNFVMRDPRLNVRVKTSTNVQYTVIFGLIPPVSCTLSSPLVRVCLASLRFLIAAP
jgi:hypothetical protein